ncbi:hypothetical protein [Leucobacter luti]|uniref:hypothetical protein n=1 Tax=Leucobacter luti TaxID=340320 RepID=UPI003D0368C7
MRWAAQRFGTWRWLDYEVPLVVKEGPEWGRSEYGIVRASVPSPVVVPLADDGRDMFEEWGTFLHHEEEGADGTVIREWTGIVRQATLDAAGWDLTIVEFPGYLDDLPYEGLARATGTDPAALVRQIVADVQSVPNGWHGVTVEGSTPYKLGTTFDNDVAAARAVMDARKRTYDALTQSKNDAAKEMQDLGSTLGDEVATARALLNDANAALAALLAAGADRAQVESQRAAIAARRAVYDTALAGYNNELAAGRWALSAAKGNKDAAKVAYDDARAAYDAMKKLRQDRGGAHEVGGDDLPNAYRAITEIAETCGFEWRTRSRYSEGAPDLAIVIEAPRVGVRRSDLVFDTAVNIVSELKLTTPGKYANAAVGVGAGEGAKALRRSMSTPSQRMRRTIVVDDKGAKTAATLDAAMRRKIRIAQAPPYPSEIEVISHPNCPIGAWGVGDTIEVVDETNPARPYRGLLRIASWQRVGRDRAKLRLEPDTN